MTSLERQLYILEKKNASSLANNLCSDHRDKQQGKPCLACELEQLRKQLEAATKCIINLKEENANLREALYN